ncbi:MAG: hypothetical protein ACOYKZ_00010 [Chlamydiia bacterium]
MSSPTSHFAGNIALKGFGDASDVVSIERRHLMTPIVADLRSARHIEAARTAVVLLVRAFDLQKSYSETPAGEATFEWVMSRQLSHLNHRLPSARHAVSQADLQIVNAEWTTIIETDTDAT